MNMQACIDEVLISGLDDWVPAVEVSYIAKTVGGSTNEDETQEFSIKIINEVVQAKLMKAGDVKEDGFHEWNLDDNEVLERIKREWTALGREPMTGEICWLLNTEEGDKRARQLEEDRPNR